MAIYQFKILREGWENLMVKVRACAKTCFCINAMILQNKTTIAHYQVFAHGITQAEKRVFWHKKYTNLILIEARAELGKYFVCFLEDMRTCKFAFEIFGPLLNHKKY